VSGENAGHGNARERVAKSIATQADRLLHEEVGPGLYVVATPIGNLGDITLRAIAILASCDAIYCEDTRHSRVLLQHFGIATPLRSYHEHNAEAARPRILAELQAGARIALISDAGTPLVSDPGFKLVREATAAGHGVYAVPGPSALTAALGICGIPTDTIVFGGFLPPRTAAREERLRELSSLRASLVFFEAPGRLVETLRSAAAVFGERETAVAREITKLHEEVRRGAPAHLADEFERTPPRGEIVILFAPPAAGASSESEIDARLAEALKVMRVRDAVDAVAGTCGAPRSMVYARALALRREGGAE
jgi:16S rRNA (cytidine1402-2'-O)-methyltransferase